MQTKVVTHSISHPQVGGCDLYRVLCVTGAVTALTALVCSSVRRSKS